MTVTSADVHRMTETLYIDGPLRGRMSSKFWILLLLASIIATAGVIADSTATVIGAMIVAPLMTPILGTALAVVLADREHVVRSVLLVLGGALVVIAIGLILGFLGAPLDGFATNGQVISRIHPKLIDLIAALATGLVGAFALVRADISDTLPGVAIAISLVPPARGGRPAALGSALLGRGGRSAALSAPTSRPSSRPERPCSSSTGFVRQPAREASRSGTFVGARWWSSRACSPSWPSR